MSDSNFYDWPVIHTHTRSDAIADGTLVPVAKYAEEAGFVKSVALTRAAWEKVVAWDEDDRPELGQSETGRLWDVLCTAHLVIRKALFRSVGDDEEPDELPFTVLAVPRENKKLTSPWPVELKIHIGPGDTPEPVLTILLPDED